MMAHRWLVGQVLGVTQGGRRPLLVTVQGLLTVTFIHFYINVYQGNQPEALFRVACFCFS